MNNFASGTQAADGMLAAVVTTLVMIKGVLLIVVELRARRRGQASVLGPREPAQRASRAPAGPTCGEIR